ncbi:Aste57867_23069 [Aphanomyces stellatus]|uniref:Aste57867_23069 protein n=1 Tax=Aphanomyces stellatus TaxID=120398 RepID=A0A485LMT1_9STRA|nr:hypothetical protein As57867_022998 [Aphanomyces stellatus]VFT99717.1 Aste57867_23069 [Aphanomyces stellatus]
MPRLKEYVANSTTQTTTASSRYGSVVVGNVVVAKKKSLWQNALELTGLVYIPATVALSFFSLGFLGVYMENNLFWPAFLASGMQSAVIDLFNAKLAFVNDTTEWNAFDSRLTAIGQVYNVPQKPLIIYATYPRRLLYLNLPSLLPAVVLGLRTLQGKEVTSMITPYCWVDLNRQWELAHSAPRQARCAIEDLDNAAVYLEIVLRNIDFAAWHEQYGALLMNAIGNTLMESRDGHAWLSYIEQHAWASVPDEVALWSQPPNHLTRFALQWANYRQVGIQETMDVINALNTKTSIQLKTIADTLLGSMWTSGTLYGSLENDLWAMKSNVSLVRASANFAGLVDPFAIEAYVAGSPLGPLQQVIHDQLGWLGNFDLKLIAPPPSLLEIVDAFHGDIVARVQSNMTFRMLFESIGTLTLNPTPRRWRDPTMVFYGGSPLCTKGAPQPFVQPSFGFADSCDAQVSYNQVWDGYNLLFALAMANNNAAPVDVCSLCLASQVSACLHMYDAALSTTLQVNATRVATDVRSLQLAWMQFVQTSNSQVPVIDVQLMVDDDQDPFVVFGWAAMYEWANGQREAVSFAGDFETLHLLSSRYGPTAMIANSLDVRKSLAFYLMYISTGVSTGLALVAVLVLLVRVLRPPRRVGPNWFVFNRVASTSWMGRPLLVVRGITALLCLATCPVVLVNFDMSDATMSSRLEYATRPVWESMLLSGEALWLTYVLNDLLFHFTHEYTRLYSPCSSLASWCICAGLDIFRPPTFRASIARTCSLFKMDTFLVCSSGTIRVGNPERLFALVVAQLVSVVATAVFCKIWMAFRVVRGAPNLLLPGAAMAFMAETSPVVGYWTLDNVSAVMCGMFYFKWRNKKFIFDMNLWLILSSDDYEFNGQNNSILIPQAATHSATSLRTHSVVEVRRLSQTAFIHATLVESPSRALKQAVVRMTPTSLILGATSRMTLFVQRGAIVVGFIHIVGSLFTNVTFIAVTARAVLANDFFWADFNSTGAQAFVANTFNRMLLVTQTARFVLDAPSLADATQMYNDTTTYIYFSETKARQHLFAPPPSLDAVVVNLRAMDPCMLPWMFTQYCWLDFNQTWTMASTSSREVRCQRDSGNGALYLESALRNINRWSAWTQCWGTSFDIGIVQTLTATSSGRGWLAQTTMAAASTSVGLEVEYWLANHIETFVLQWQNYKTLGMVDSIRIQNVFNVQHPITISNRKGAFHLDQQTSLKMYWSFASDLWAIGTNDTAVGGLSLLRSSSAFAFLNVSSLQLLLQNNTVASPLTSGFQAFQVSVGALGAIDMKFIQPPPSLLFLYSNVLGNLTLLAVDASVHTVMQSLPTRAYIGQFPPALGSTTVSLLGGNILCGGEMPPLPFTAPVSSPMYLGFSTSTTCGMYDTDYFTPDTYMGLFALFGINQSQAVSSDDIDAFCVWDTYPDATCTQVYTEKLAFLATYASEALAPLSSQVIQVQHDVFDRNIVYTQYIQNSSETTTLYQVGLLDNSTSRAWPFFGWCFLYSWAAGLREVVSFQGDAGTVTTVSSSYNLLTMTPNSADIPHDLAFLLQVAIVYITALFLCLALLVVLYTVASRGHIKGMNLFKFSRLVGLVWAGRTFLVIRSVTAAIMLDTTPLTLVQIGTATRFVSPPITWYNMMLATMELQWVVFVITDAISFVTRHRTSKFAGKCVWLVWAVVVTWTFVQSNQHSVTLERSCTVTDMDVMLTCSSGIVVIGDFTRMCISVGICVAAVLVSYVAVLVFVQHDDALEISSLMLSSQAKYLLDLTHWTFQGQHYLDKPTALMAGIVSLDWRGKLYLFDIKKWRVVITVRHEANQTTPARFRYAIPLIE